VNTSGVEVFPPIYEKVWDFTKSEDQFATTMVKLNGEEYFVSSEGAEEFAWYEIKGKRNMDYLLSSLRQLLGVTNFKKSIWYKKVPDYEERYSLRIFDNCNDISSADQICISRASDSAYHRGGL